MDRNWKLLGVASGALVVACQWKPPLELLPGTPRPQELRRDGTLPALDRAPRTLTASPPGAVEPAMQLTSGR